jgi:UPF0755 protein
MSSELDAAGIPAQNHVLEPAQKENVLYASRFGGLRVAPRSPKEALQPDAAPPPPAPPHRRRPGLSAFSGFLSFLLIAAIGSMAAIIWGEHRVHEPGPLESSKVIYIAPGTEVPDIIAELERQGVVDSPFLLNMALLAEGRRSKVKSGEYLFKENVSVQEVIDTLVSGRQVLHAVTIPEGLTSEQIVERLRESDILVGEIAEIPKEGSLLPETYKVTRGAVRADLIKKMQDGQRRVVDQIWMHRASGLPLRSPYELITLASIVEKETGKADERPRVASVFLNRLKKGMRLQSDPTIVYGLTQGKGPLGRGITRSELEKPTPYNTYLVDGLPPSPIANPGRAALEAVANPSRTQDLYFVADGNGGHVFSETLDQHSRNVQRWRQIEQDAKDKQESVAPDAAKAPQETQPASPAASPANGKKSEMPGHPVYGALPHSFSGSENAIRPPLAPVKASDAIAKAMPQNSRKAAPHTAGTRASAYMLGPGLEELGISMGGLKPSKPVLDGPGGEEDQPAVPARDSPGLPDTPARIERATAPAGMDQPDPPEGAADKRPKAFDASQGTAFDPLQNKTYDLNYAKTVPAVK